MIRLTPYLIAVVCAALLFWTGCDSGPNEPDPEVITEDLVVGTGEVADGIDVVTVHWVGMLQDSTVFEDTRDGNPFQFQLLSGVVVDSLDNVVGFIPVRGLVRGVDGMRVGGKRRITVPPELAFGGDAVGCDAVGNCLIPPFATLVFVVDLLAVRTPADAVPLR